MNIDKDIEIVKDFINNKVEKDKLELNFKGGHKIGVIYKTTELNPALENVLKELETYKKIAENLAEIMAYLPIYEDGTLYDTKEAVIDWVRKEVENDEN